MQEYVYTILIFVFAALFAISFLLLKNQKLSSLLIKAAAIVCATCFVIRHILQNPEYASVIGLNPTFEISRAMLIFSMLMIWFQGAGVIIACLAPFFKIKYSGTLATFLSLPVAVLNALFFFVNAKLATGGGGLSALDIRTLAYAAEITLTLAISAVITIQRRSFRVRLKEIPTIITSIIFMILAATSVYMPQFFLGMGKPSDVEGLSLVHRYFIYPGFVFPLALYFIFRRKDMQIKRYAVLYISLATLMSYSQIYLLKSFTSPATMPLHLCNTAMYIIPICLIFKTEKLFFFTYFINVLGAFLAITIPNYGAVTFYSVRLVSFWVNHWCAFAMPLLIVSLGVFPRPRAKQFRYSMIGFGVYYVLILFINAYYSNFGWVDFFFINSDFVISKFPTSWQKIRDIAVTITRGEIVLRFYPLYQGLYFLVYFAAAFGLWFLYENIFMLSERLHILFERKKKIRQDEIMLKKELGGQSLNEPINKECTNMIRITKFSKRYGSSKNFAVKDLDLDIIPGEIFGFLGPNGSGKSTLIKSLVGLQPLTSGKMEVFGYDVEKQSIQTKSLIGFVPDHYALYEKLTGREYINYIADLYRIGKDERNQRINHFLKLFELAHAFDDRIKTYSHGMKQKVAIMAALVHNPRVWILDEPLTGLDPNSIFQVKETMKAHARAGNIVFFSSHIMDVVEKVCDRIAIIKKGAIIARAKVEDIEKAGWEMEKFYLSTIENGVAPV